VNGIEPAEDRRETKRKASQQEEPAPRQTEIHEQAVPAAAAAIADGEHPTKKIRKKPRWTDEKKESARKEREDGSSLKLKEGKDQPQAKKKAKKTKDNEEITVRPLAPEERISGPSNAEEAQKMRQALGFALPEAEKGLLPQGTNTFQFAFSSEPTGHDQSVAAAAAVPIDEKNRSEEEDGVKAEGGAASQKTSSSGTSDSSSSGMDGSSSDEDEDEQDMAQTKNAPDALMTHATVTSVGDGSVDESEYVPNRVYVGGMPYAYTENDVREYWEYCGSIESLDILTFPDTGRFRGIAFITFATADGFLAALECNGIECDGQTLKVQRCKWSAKDKQGAAKQGKFASTATAVDLVVQPRNQAPTVNGQGLGETPVPGLAYIVKPPAPKTSGYDVAYVGNVAYEADENALKALFEPYGVTKVRLHTEKDTGRSKGYAHVHFK